MALTLSDPRVNQADDSENTEDWISDRGPSEALETPAEGPTLLWRGVATTVTLSTSAASASIRAGVGIGKYGFAIARQATHTWLNVGHFTAEQILKAAGRDVTAGQQVELRREEAENIVTKSVLGVHSAFSAMSIMAASGFYLGESAMYGVSDGTLSGLYIVNALFGSTDTSRAIAAIVSLMRKELYKPGADGEAAETSMFNLITTVAGFLFLQRSGRRRTEVQWRAAGGDATVWDIVIDDRGFRADVIGTRRQDNLITASRSVVQSPIDEEPSDEFGMLATQVEDGVSSNTVALSSQDQTSLTDEEIKERIMDQLPPGTHATITTETVLLKTVKVNIHGSETANIEAPPGMVMVSEHPNFENSADGQTVIFRTASKVQSRAKLKKHDALAASAFRNDKGQKWDDGRILQGLSLRPPLPSIASQDGEINGNFHTEPLPPYAAQHTEKASSTIPSGPVANQKKARKAMGPEPLPNLPTLQSKLPQPSTGRRERSIENAKFDKLEKPGVIKKALKSLSPNQSSAALNKMMSGSSRHRSNSGGVSNSFSSPLRPLTSTKDGQRKPVFQMPTTQPTTPLLSPSVPISGNDGVATSYFTVHEKRRESTYSEIDSYSVHSNESRPPSPTMSRTHLRAANSISKTHSQTEISIHPHADDEDEVAGRNHRRSRSFVPSLYSMGTKNEKDESVVLAPKTPVPRKSIFEDNKMLMALARDGRVPGQFPSAHLILTLRRFVRFASAAYGEHFLKLMGLAQKTKGMEENERKRDLQKILHREHESFSSHTGLPPETIVKSSFLDPEGLASSTSDGFSPIIHFVSIDLEAKAIVLTCRGTLGFEDLLTDMACDYADLHWQGQTHKVHRGIRDSARRLIDSHNGNHIMAVLKASLEEYPEFGLVLVGHSLGGAVAALVATMLSEPSDSAPGDPDTRPFVTAAPAKLLTSKPHDAASRNTALIQLPPGRQIHVYAFGSPACVSSGLRTATRGLVTSVINANDIVPYLSLGTLHDFRIIASRLKEDISGAFSNIKQRATARILQSVSNYLWSGPGHPQSPAVAPPPGTLAGDGLGEDNWAWNELVEMRKIMTSEKLYPPGEIFTLESTRVFDRDPDEGTTEGAEQARHYTSLGRPATRMQFKWVKDVERRFAEVRFGRSMFHEHSPTAYESNMSALERGVCEDA